MISTKGKRLQDKCLSLFLPLFLFCFSVSAQTYNPSVCCTVSNKAYGSAQATTTDGRSWFYDATNFVMRDYNGTTEVFSYLNLAKYRSGHFPIYVHSGGLLQGNGVWLGGITLVYWFKDSTGNANLVRWYTDSTGMPGGPFYAVANNLSEGNAGLIKGNLALDNVDNTSDAQKNAASVTLTNHSISGTTNTLTNIPNSALTNNSTGLSVTSAAGSDISVPTTPAALGSSIVLNVPSGGPSSRGAITSVDWNTFNNKQAPITLTVAGTSGPATLVGPVLNIPQYSAGSLCIGCNADSLKKLPVDTTSNRNGYILAFDSTNHKWYLTPNAGSGSGITQLTGDVTAGPGSGSQAATLATVNSNVGTFGSASGVYVGTINGKGLTTAGSTVAIQIAESQVTNLVSDLAAKQSTTLTSGHLLVGNGSNVATDVPLSGDGALANTGALTVTGIKGAVLPSLATGNLRYTGSAWTFDNTSYLSQVYGKNSIVSLGTDTVQLVNDTANPLRWQFYGTSIKDSTKGYRDIEENFFGNIYSQNSWVNATTGFVNKGGATVSVVSNKLQFSAGASNFTQGLFINWPSMLDKWSVTEKFIVGSNNANSTDGPAIGKYSINSTPGAQANLSIRFIMGSGTGSGKIALIGIANTLLKTSDSALTSSIGDRILLTIERDGYAVYGTARNMTTNSSTVYLSYNFTTYLPNSPATMDNTGLYGTYSLGGTFTVDSLVAETKTVKNGTLAIIGDSKIQGYYVTNQADRIGDQVGLLIRSTIISAGGSDKLQEVETRLQEIFALKHRQVLNLAGSNNVRAGEDSTTYCTRYDSLNTALSNAGIDVYVGVLYESAVNLLPLWHHIQQVYPASHVINLYENLRQAGVNTPDSIHLTSFGDSLAANYIIKKYQIYGQNQRYSTPPSNYIWNQSNSTQPNASFRISGVGTGAAFQAGSVLMSPTITSEVANYATLGLSSGQGVLTLGNPNGATNEKFFDLFPTGTHVYLRLLGDVTGANNVLDLVRSGTNLSSFTVNGPQIISTTATPLSFALSASQNGVAATGTVTGFVRPMNATVSATAGTQLLQSNTSTNSGAYSNVLLTTAGSASGSPTIAYQYGSTKAYHGINRNTTDFEIEANQDFFSEFGGTKLAYWKTTGQMFLGAASRTLNRMLNIKGTVNIAKDSLPINSAGSVMSVGIDTTSGDIVRFPVSSGGISRISPLDSLAKSANGLQISGVSLVPQTADASFPGLMSTGSQTFAGSKTFSTGQVILGAFGTRNWNPGLGTSGDIVGIIPGTLNDNVTAASGGLSDVGAMSMSQPTFSASNTGVTYSRAYSLYIGSSPTAGTNMTLTNSYGLGVFGGSYLQGGVNYGGHLFNTVGAIGSSSAGAGAGTSPTITVVGNDQDGSVTVLTGTSPSGSSTVITITYSSAFPTNTFPTLTPANAATAALNGLGMVYTTGSTTNFTITAGATALAAATTYKWYYHVGGN